MMLNERKGVQSIRTMGVLVDRRRARTSAGALLEMSALASEKERLQRELDRLGRRRSEIETRLAEIEVKGRRLQGFVKKGQGLNAESIPGNDTLKRMRTRELRY